MAQTWTRQIRIYLSETFAEVARKNPQSDEMKALNKVLSKHNASLKCQYDAFAGYVNEAETAIKAAKGTPHEKRVQQDYFLYQWTKDTIENPTKKAKYQKEFTIYVAGQETYDTAIANAIEADLKPLIDGQKITNLRNRDSNPKNNPQMPKKYL